MLLFGQSHLQLCHMLFNCACSKSKSVHVMSSDHKHQYSNQLVQDRCSCSPVRLICFRQKGLREYAECSLSAFGQFTGSVVLCLCQLRTKIEDSAYSLRPLVATSCILSQQHKQPMLHCQADRARGVCALENSICSSLIFQLSYYKNFHTKICGCN